MIMKIAVLALLGTFSISVNQVPSAEASPAPAVYYYPWSGVVYNTWPYLTPVSWDYYPYWSPLVYWSYPTYTYSYILRDGNSKSFLEVVDLTAKNLTGNTKEKFEEMKETYAELEVKVQNDMKELRKNLRNDLSKAQKTSKKAFSDMKKRAKIDMQHKYDESYKKIETAQQKVKEWFDFIMPEANAAAKLTSTSSPPENQEKTDHA